MVFLIEMWIVASKLQTLTALVVFCLVCERDGYERKGRQGIEKKRACIHNPALSLSFLSSCISNIHREEIAWTRERKGKNEMQVSDQNPSPSVYT